MALIGQLQEFHLHNIIALLQVERQTGELLIEAEGGRRTALYLQEGVVVHAQGAAEGGFAAAVEPFGWGGGKFHFEAYVLDVEPTITEGNAALVSAGRKRAVEAAELQERVPTLYLVLRLVPHATSTTGYINLSPDEWRFLTLVDGHRDLAAIAALQGREAYAVRVAANRLLKAGLVQAVDPRRSMVRMTVQPIDAHERPPADPMIALMDDLALDLLLKGNRLGRHTRILVLNAAEGRETLLVEGRPDLADRLLLSTQAMARLGVQRNDYVHIKPIEES